MTTTQIAPAPTAFPALPEFARLTGEQGLYLRDRIANATSRLGVLIEEELTAAGYDLNKDDVLHERNEECLELHDMLADLDELLRERY